MVVVDNIKCGFWKRFLAKCTSNPCMYYEWIHNHLDCILSSVVVIRFGTKMHIFWCNKIIYLKKRKTNNYPNP